MTGQAMTRQAMARQAMARKSALRRLWNSSDGVSVVEFGFIAPLFIMIVFGTLELGYGIYASSMLNGAVHAAGRDSGLENAQGGQAGIDAALTSQVSAVVPSAALTFTRQNYQEFSDVGKPEDFVDTNANGDYDDTECFTDENDNVTWDADVGADGQGGANDVVLYTVNMKFDRFIPVGGLFGLQGQRDYTAKTTLRNQPFGTQGSREPTQVCP